MPIPVPTAIGVIRCEVGRCRAPARFFPVLTIDGWRDGHPGAGGIVAKVVVCVRCKAALTVHDVLSDQGWRMLQAAAEKFGVRINGGRRSVQLAWASLRGSDDFALEQRLAAAVRQRLN